MNTDLSRMDMSEATWVITKAPPHSCNDNADYRHIEAENELMKARIKALRDALAGLLADYPERRIANARAALDA